jgi:hypothetical protein
MISCLPDPFPPIPSKMSPARARWVLARPRTLLDRASTEILLPRKIFLGLKYCFILFYTMKYAGGSPRPRPGLSPAQKNKPDLPIGIVMDRTFRPEIIGPFRPGPNHTRPAKCSGTTPNEKSGCWSARFKAREGQGMQPTYKSNRWATASMANVQITPNLITFR